ncbi:hypothetical protein FA95DRAFT_613933 [Auriscalpium vulgare]|uniref:Uncharacterized protein n=1 Tax=Auriscalpium vulgare TaxID=40419 RepID=A0ACB8REJ9_9AGAM|nr:hypothetical protein FA95DRAFT_613933 [Auriscalpium vulgare]
MAAFGTQLLQRVRTLGQRLFHRFGIHCATHQIRVILISAVVITSLSYPALAIYSAQQPRFLAHFSSQILDPFRAADAISSYYAQHDLWNVWTAHDPIHVREDSVVRARCGVEHTLRVERVLIHSAAADGTGALNHQVLMSALHLEQRIASELAMHHVPCLRRPGGQCLVITPLEFWKHDAVALRGDGNVQDTLSIAKNVSISGMPIVPQMVLAGREANEYPSMDAGSSMFLALTFFFPETDCLGHSGHATWLQILEESTKDHADLMTERQAPKLVALEYKTHNSPSANTSVLTAFIYVAYMAFAVMFGRGMRNTLPVHNGLGLVFTGAVEVIVSTITSLSVCALVGFRVTMIPWGIFPLVILVIGAENMFTLVEAIVRTSIALPVKERVAEGLSRAGTSNSLKVLTYNIILGVIAFFARGATRQFCAFAVVVLVAHWFLVHTFFVAVLSIDLQRLELDELLQQNTTFTPSVPSPQPKQTTVKTNTKGGRLFVSFKSLLRGRATKNISLLLLLATSATLYFVTYPTSRLVGSPQVPLTSPSALARTKIAQPDNDPAWHTWRLLNPAEDALVHLRIESPTILMFRPAGTGSATDLPSDGPTALLPHRSSRFSYSWSARAITWLLRIFVLPMAATVGILYGILLYLLKDAERLEAQRHITEVDVQVKEEEVPVEETIAFTALPRAISTDVELIAASRDGRVVATVGLENELVIWFGDKQVHWSVDTTDVLLRGASTSSAASAITALALTDAGTVCAVGTGAGVIAIWSIGADMIKPLPQLILQSASSAVVGLQFVNPRVPGTSTPARSRISSFEAPPVVFSAYENGTVAQWNTLSPESPFMVTPFRPGFVLWSSLLRLPQSDRILAAFATDDGAVELVDVVPSTSDVALAIDCRLPAGNPSDNVVRVHASYVEMGGSRTVIVAAATQAGVVSLWDGSTTDCIAILDDAHGQINNMRISPIASRSCTQCGEQPVDSFTLSFSVGQNVLFYRAFMPSDGRHCSCAHNQPQGTISWTTTLGVRSRSSSMASSSSVAPSRSRHGSVTDESAFPISGHGVLSRRASEKDLLRRSSDTLPVTLDGDESDSVGPLDTPPLGAASMSRWKGLAVMRAADATFERGSWDVVDGRVVGVRRRPRARAAQSAGPLHLQHDSAKGLSAASMERWEVWTFDPSASRFQASPLASLDKNARDKSKTSVSPSSSASKHSQCSTKDDHDVPRLPFTRVSPFVSGCSYCLAGFGNTVGFFSFASSADYLERNLSSRLAHSIHD